MTEHDVNQTVDETEAKKWAREITSAYLGIGSKNLSLLITGLLARDDGNAMTPAVINLIPKKHAGALTALINRVATEIIMTADLNGEKIRMMTYLMGIPVQGTRQNLSKLMDPVTRMNIIGEPMNPSGILAANGGMIVMMAMPSLKSAESIGYRTIYMATRYIGSAMASHNVEEMARRRETVDQNMITTDPDLTENLSSDEVVTAIIPTFIMGQVESNNPDTFLRPASQTMEETTKAGIEAYKARILHHEEIQAEVIRKFRKEAQEIADVLAPGVTIGRPESWHNAATTVSPFRPES